MQIGLVYPQTEYPTDPAAVRDYAQAAEALGYSHVLAYDHILGASPDRPGGWSGPYTSLPYHGCFCQGVCKRLPFFFDSAPKGKAN